MSWKSIVSQTISEEWTGLCDLFQAPVVTGTTATLGSIVVNG